MTSLSSWRRWQLILPCTLLAAFLCLGTYHQPHQEGQAATLTVLEAALDARNTEVDGVATSSTAPPGQDASEYGLTTSTVKTSGASRIVAPKRVYVPLVKRSKEGRSKKGKVGKGKRKAWWPVELLPTNASALLTLAHGSRLTTQEEGGGVKERLQVMVERATHVARVCSTRTRHDNTAGRLVWRLDQTPSMVWCPRYSQARESDLSYNPTKGKEKAEAFQKSLRAIFVGHPFTRLLTAYLEKLTTKHPTPPKYRKLQQTIVSQYRSLASRSLASRSSRSSRGPVFPTFPQFVQYVLDSTSNFTTSKHWRQTVTVWTPYWAECSVCSSDYNVIVKQETMEEDLRFLAALTDLKHSEELAKETWGRLGNETWTRKAAAESPTTSSSTTTISSSISKKFFSQLTRQQLKELYKRYETDFQLFGYSADEHLALAREG
nr:uncharacterized protein LOC123766867 isoform X1 [Procambarus clarkii]